MIILKTQDEIAAMRRGGQVVAEALRRAGAALRPGLRTSEIDEIVGDVFTRYGAVPLLLGAPGPEPFPATVCVSVNDEAAHGIPGGRRLAMGDLVSVDTACRLDGWCADAAWTWSVGAAPDEHRQLLSAGRAALELAIGACAGHGHWSEAAAAIEAFVGERGCALVDGPVGHGIGREMHEDPEVPGHVTPELRRADFRLDPGLVLAIELTVTSGGDTSGSGRLRRLPNGWTLATADGRPAVHFEHTVAIDGEGPVVLTAGIAD